MAAKSIIAMGLVCNAVTRLDGIFCNKVKLLQRSFRSFFAIMQTRAEDLSAHSQNVRFHDGTRV